MNVIWKASLRFGLVSIPVSLSAARDRDGGYLRLIHRDCGRPVLLKKICTEHGELDPSEVASGVEIAPGEFAVVESNEDDDQAEENGSREIEILRFVSGGEVDPIYFDRAYYLAPAGTASPPGYALLTRAMAELDVGAIARFVLWRKTNVAFIRPLEQTLVLHTLFHGSDVRSTVEIVEAVEGQEVGEKELKLARQLARRMVEPFDPSALEVKPRAERGRATLELATNAAATKGAELAKTLRKTLRPREKATR